MMAIAGLLGKLVNKDPSGFTGSLAVDHSNDVQVTIGRHNGRVFTYRPPFAKCSQVVPTSPYRRHHDALENDTESMVRQGQFHNSNYIWKLHLYSDSHCENEIISKNFDGEFTVEVPIKSWNVERVKGAWTIYPKESSEQD